MLAPLMVEGQDWQIWEEHGRIAFQDAEASSTCRRRNLIGAHQVDNAGIAIAALRALGIDEAACAAARHPRRMAGPPAAPAPRPLVEAAGRPSSGSTAATTRPPALALAEALTRLAPRPLHLVTGMLRTKDAAGFLARSPALARSLHAVSIPGEAATPAEETVAAARAAGLAAAEPPPT